MEWKEKAKQVIAGEELTKAEALDILQSTDDDLLAVLDAAFLIRKHYFGRAITLHILRNAKSGNCSEDCAYCSQSGSARTDIPHYSIQTIQQLLEGAREAHRLKALRYCIVISGRGPAADDLDLICEAVRQIKQEIPIQICTSLGLLNLDQAKRLKESGVDRFNHNLETSERYYSSICTTHKFADRLRTTRLVKSVGMELCSGGLIGMGESVEDRVDLAFALREIASDSIPLNFLDPRPGTALNGLARVTPSDCLRSLAMFRFVNPDKEIRIAGGRETTLGQMQVLSLYIANSIFTKGYLTTPGQDYDEDMDMIEKAGFHIVDWTAA